jgi:hypothetical protein
MEDGVFVLCVFKRSRGVMRSISMGKVTVQWLFAVLEELLKAEASKVVLKSSKVGSKAYIVNRCANRFSRFLAIAEYGGGASWLF